MVYQNLVVVNNVVGGENLKAGGIRQDLVKQRRAGAVITDDENGIERDPVQQWKEPTIWWMRHCRVNCQVYRQVQFTAKCGSRKRLTGTEVVLVPNQCFLYLVHMDIPSPAMVTLTDFKAKMLSLGCEVARSRDSFF